MYLLRILIFSLIVLSWAGLATGTDRVRDITILDQHGSVQIPAWKNLWDQARELVSEEKYEQAISTYQHLLKEKPQLEAAQFEYARLLKLLGRCNETVAVLDKLAQNSPDHLEYYLPIADCLDTLRLFERAASYYGQLYYKDPYGKYSIPALEGLIASLKKQGKSDSLSPLLHQLVLRKPDSLEPLYQLARYLYKAGNIDEAADYYIKLLDRFRLTDEVLLEIEAVLEESNSLEELLKVRLLYLSKNPEDLIKRQKVAKYYLKTQQFDEALEQYEILTRLGADVDAELVLKVALLYYDTTDRMDKALQAFELYLQYDPYNRAVKEKIEKIQRVLAHDFVAIIKNDGATLLWKDLEKLTSSRKTIFLLMADNLKNEGNDKRYQEILELLHQENPQDQNILILIAQQLVQNQQYQQAMRFLQKTNAASKKRDEYFSILEEIVFNLEDEYAAYDLIVNYLETENRSPEVYAVTFRLALMTQHFHQAEKYFQLLQHDNQLSKVDFSSWLTFINYLYQKGDFTLSGTLIEDLLPIFSREPENLLVLKSLKIQEFWLKDQFYCAEQRYRALVIENPRLALSYLTLLQFFVDTGRIKETTKWLKSIDDNGIVEWTAHGEQQKSFKQFLVEREIALKHYNAAISMVKKQLTDALGDLSTGEQFSLKKLLAKIYFLKQDYQNFSKEIILLLKSKQKDAFAQTAAEYILDQKLPGYEQVEKWFDRTEELSLLSSLETYIDLGLQQVFLTKVEKKDNVSPALFFQIARSYEMMNRYDDAITYYQKLRELYPEQSFYQKKIIELYFKIGKFETVLEELADFGGDDFRDIACPDFKLSVLEARTLWAMDQHQESIEKYASLLSSPVFNELRDKQNVKVVLQACFPDEKSLENVALSDDDLDELLAMVFQPEWIVHNIERKEVLRINTFYSDFRRQQLIKKELSARQSILDRDYFYAEMQVEKIIKETDEEILEEQLLDLADIYNRLGKYAQEAEVYEKLADNYQESQKLSSRIEKNRQLLKPLNSIYYDYTSEEGRDGLKDTIKKEFGVTGKVPSLINHLFEVGYNYQLYSDFSSDAEAHLHQLYGQYTINFSDDYEISTRIGSVKRESGDSTLVYDVKIEGQIDQYFRTYAKVSQTLVNDTLESINGSIYKRDYEIGFIVDSIPRVVLGGNGIYRQISDDNSQQLVNLYAAFNVFREKWHFQAKYAVDAFLSENDEKLETKDSFGGYWAPDSFWRHQLLLYVDILLNENRSFGGAPGHISLQYGIGYEDDEAIVHSGEANIFVEMNSNILLKGSLSFLDTEEYTSRDAMLSLIFRW